MIVLYAITPRREQGSASPAAADAGLEGYDAGDLTILHREQPDAPRQETAEVIGYGTVLRALAAEGPILPVRFGSVVTDRSALADLVKENAAEWSTLLESLGGHSELIVHLPDRPTPAPPTGESGREYLTARAAALHAQEARLDALRRLPGVRDARLLPGRRRTRVSLLVADAEVEAARAAVAQWAADEGAEKPPVTGPWPPFSFCEVVAR